MSYSEKPFRLGFDPEELHRRSQNNATFVLPPCGMSFMDDHYGPRPGCIHTLLGSTGRGKSTLVHSLLTSWGAKAKILLYLTEESFERVESKLALKGDDMSYLTPKLHLVHEQDVAAKINPKDADSWLRQMRAKIVESECKILILDNLTTSIFYEGQFQNVNTILTGLRKMAADLEIPVFVVAHTKKGISEATKGLISPDDVRGSASLAMTSDYFYIFYRIRKTSSFGQPKDSAFVYIGKSRDHDNQDFIYKLDYDPVKKKYFRDAMVNFTMFKDYMKERDRA